MNDITDLSLYIKGLKLDREHISQKIDHALDIYVAKGATLLDVAKLRIKAKEMGIKDLALQGKYLKIAPFKISESAQLRIQRLYPGSIVKSVTNTLLIARPTVAAWSQESQKIGDTSLLNWVNESLAELNSPIKQREGK